MAGLKARDFNELIRLEMTDDPNVFLSCSHPEAQGNTARIAYGGCTIALIVQAAYKTVEDRDGVPDFNIYSLVGNYLGPALPDRQVKLKVDIVRDTRTFATRLVTAFQTWDTGVERSCFSALVDFQAPVPKLYPDAKAPFAPFSSKPTTAVIPKPEDLPEWRDVVEDRCKQGAISRAVADGLLDTFDLGFRMTRGRQLLTSVHHQNMMGTDTSRPNEQHHLALTDRVAADWFCSRTDLRAASPPPASNPRALPVSSRSANACYVAFTMDAAVAFIPLTFSDLPLSTAGACSSLDCALRFHTEAPDMKAWHLREMKTICGNTEKTYSEARLWDGDFNMVATINQASILRPRPSSKDRSEGKGNAKGAGTAKL